MAYNTRDGNPAEPEALKHSFSYLINSIDTTALLPAALSKDLITERQRSECSSETEAYKKAETFVGYLLRAVNGNCYKFYTFLQILQETNQTPIASHLRDELAHSIRSMQLSTPSNTDHDKGLEQVDVPDTLLEELGDLRFAFARLIRNYEKKIHQSPEAQEEFVAFLPRLFHREVIECDFQSHFNTLIEEEVSLFNIFYLKRICSIFPEDVRTSTRQLVDEYEKQRQQFMAGTTVNQFKQLFPASATSSKLSAGKISVKLKLKNYWDNDTIEDLTKLVALFGVSGSHLHLSKVEDGCIAVTWLCSAIEVKQLKITVSDIAEPLQDMGMLQVFIGEELLLECSQPDIDTALYKAKQFESPSYDDLPQISSGVQQTAELMTATDHSRKPAVYLVHEIDIDYLCPICTEPITEPYLSIECGHLLCQQCRDHLLSIGKIECPTCREPDVLKNAVLDKHFQRKVKNLIVRCSEYKKGCEWIGELRNLQDHLDPDKRQCVVVCPFACLFCHNLFARQTEMREHSHFHCPERMMSCEYCDYYNTFTIVTEKHTPICHKFPIDCPNHCPAESFRRHLLQKHLKECTHQLVNCPKSGCSVQLPRGEMKLHTTQQHDLVLEETIQEVAVTPATVSPQYLYNQAPIEFIISDFQDKKEANAKWISSSFYSHRKGYRFHIKIYPNGSSAVRGSCVSVFAALLKGKYDENLEWPFEGVVVVEILNWKEDKNHFSLAICLDRSKSKDPHSKHTSRIIDRKVAPGYGIPLFISHTGLAPTTSTEYLLDDHLKLRFSVVVYSTPLLHLTPAWQDSLVAMQSGTEFTIPEYSKRKQFNNEYWSQPFTTSPQGYKLCIVVLANGDGSGRDSHLSIFANIMKGQHDDQLKWPFTGDIIIGLINWLEDDRHYKQTLSIDVNDNFARVSDGEYGNNSGYYQFIHQTSLSLNSPTNSTQYLYQDCIRVRVQCILENN